MTDLVVVDGKIDLTFQITRDADWNDPLPMISDNDGPLDLTAGRRLDLYIRPTFDHSILIKRLSSFPDDGARGIVILAPGVARIAVPRSIVRADLPQGTWDHFLVLLEYPEYPLPATPDAYREIWRGRLIVHPANIQPY